MRWPLRVTWWGWSGVKVLPAQPKQGFAKVQVPGQEGRTQGHSPAGGLWDLIREAQDFPEVTLFPNVNSPGMPNPSLSPYQVRGPPRKHLAHSHGWRDPAQGRGSGKLLTHYVPSTCPPPNPGGLLGLATPTRCPTRESGQSWRGDWELTSRRGMMRWQASSSLLAKQM